MTLDKLNWSKFSLKSFKLRKLMKITLVNLMNLSLIQYNILRKMSATEQ